VGLVLRLLHRRCTPGGTDDRHRATCACSRQHAICGRSESSHEWREVSSAAFSQQWRRGSFTWAPPGGRSVPQFSPYVQPNDDGRTLGRCGKGFWGGCKPRYFRCPSVPHDGQVHTVHKSAARGFYPWGRYKVRGLCRRVVTSRRSAYDLPTPLSLLPPTHARSRAHGRLSHGSHATCRRLYISARAPT
jgi:hypothetical protein